MKTTLYYFSGTGNSLAVAGQIKEQLEECELVSIPQMTGAYGTDLRIEGDGIGIVCPIYMHNMPHIVSRFIERINGAGYLFMVYTGAGELGNGLRKTRKLFSRRGLALSALFNVPMPSNYAPYGCPEQSVQSERIAGAKKRIDEIADIVKSRAVHFDGSNTGFIATHLYPGLLYKLGYPFIPKMDGNFTVEESCTHCGICQQVCPVGNISLQDGRPAWKHGCEQCYACLQWCPANAIEYGKQTHGVQRYHHPDIRLKEIQAGTA